jgi:predicted kinase
VSPSAPDVIIIRGAPGSGKSQTAKLLASHLGRGARIEVDALRSMVFPVDWTNQNEHISVLNIASRVVADFVRLGHRPVIVVDTFSGDKVVRFLSDLREQHRAIEVRAFALFVAPPVLRARVEQRPAFGFRDLDVCLKLNADILEHLQPFERLVDNSGLTPEETVQAVLAGFA